MAMNKSSEQSVAVAGLLLAGGEGRRMGGVDKGLVPWLGVPMAHRIYAELARVVTPVLVSANRNLEQYRTLAPGLVFGDGEDFRGQGPLAGLYRGLTEAGRLGLQAVLVCPCDTPDMTADVFSRLLEAWREDPEHPLVAECEGRVHPLHGIYPVACAPLLEQQLRLGNRRVMAFARMAGVRRLVCDQAAGAFRNRNYPEDLQGH